MLHMLQWFFLEINNSTFYYKTFPFRNIKTLMKKNDCFHGELTRSAYVALKLTKSYLNTI